MRTHNQNNQCNVVGRCDIISKSQLGKKILLKFTCSRLLCLFGQLWDKIINYFWCIAHYLYIFFVITKFYIKQTTYIELFERIN
jgi:hypothetical protein